MIPHTAWIRAAAFALLLTAGTAARPCTAAPLCKCARLSVQDELARADAVFSGVVLHVGPPAGRSVLVSTRTEFDSAGWPTVTPTYRWEGEQDTPVTLRVDRGWKGAAAGDSITILNMAICGLGFRVGEAYVVYAVRERGALRTSYCMRTRALPHAADDARMLDSITRAAPP